MAFWLGIAPVVAGVLLAVFGVMFFFAEVVGKLIVAAAQLVWWYGRPHHQAV